MGSGLDIGQLSTSCEKKETLYGKVRDVVDFVYFRFFIEATMNRV